MAKISKFDAADYLKTPEAVAVYRTEAFATHDATYICIALDTIAKATGVTSAQASAPRSNSSGGKT